MAKLKLEITDDQGRVLLDTDTDTDTGLFLCLLEADGIPDSLQALILQAADDELRTLASPLCGDPICDDPQCGGPWAKPHHDNDNDDNDNHED